MIWQAKKNSKKKVLVVRIEFWCRIFLLALACATYLPYLSFRDLPVVPSPRPVEPPTAMMCWTMPRLEPRPKNFLHKFCSDCF